MVMCGMSAAFSGLFGTPITAAIFAMEVVSVGVMYYAAIVPCVVSSLVSVQLARFFGLHIGTGYLIGNVAVLGPWSMAQVCVMGVLCALLSILFCKVMHAAPKLYAKYFPNPLVRAAVGGALVLLLTLLVGEQTYNGAGDAVIRRMLAGETISEAFLLKLVFTALTLGAGFRGGEIVPVLFTGAAFGTVVGPLLGLSQSFGGALGMTAVFCGATNCPITSILLAYELFTSRGLPLYALCCAISLHALRVLRPLQRAEDHLLQIQGHLGGPKGGVVPPVHGAVLLLHAQQRNGGPGCSVYGPQFLQRPPCDGTVKQSYSSSYFIKRRHPGRISGTSPFFFIK